MMRRLKKEYRLNVCNSIILKCGTVNRDDPQVIYITGKCWISPQSEMDYEDSLYEIEKKMKSSIKDIMIDGVNFDKKFILDFDINVDDFKPNLKRFLTFDFYLRQNKDNKRQLSLLRPLLKWKVGAISNNLVRLFNENNFLVEKRK